MHKELIRFLREGGASLVGFADISALPREQTRGFTKAVSIAIALDPAVVRGIPSGPHEDYSREYDQVNQQLDQLGLEAEQWLKDRGKRALALTRERVPYHRDTCISPFPYKTAATLAGLGWIGRNALLITPQYGAAQRLSCILTDAVLPPGTPELAPRCGSCNACVRACPGKAISGRLWTPGISRDDLVSFRACQETVDSRGLDLKLRSVTCGLCVAACPHTKRYLSQAAH